MNWFKPMGIAMAFGAVCVGCASMSLKSDNAAERMAAVKEITDQSDLLDVALNKEYQNDIRLDAVKRLKNQRNLWRVWCENGENKAISDESLKLLTDEMLLARVALMHSYEESADEKEARQLSETKKAWGVGLAAAAVNVGGAAAASKAGGAGGALAVSAGTAAANIGLAAALSKESRPTPSMSIRTNDALIAVSRIKSEDVVSNVAMKSTISCIYLKAFRKFLEMTDCMDALKFAVIRGEMKDARADSCSCDDLRKNRIFALKSISDERALQDVLKDGNDEVTHLAFARMIQLKRSEAVVDALCEHSIGRLLQVDAQGGDNDVSENSATKLVERIEGTDHFEKLALRSKSIMIAKAAVRKITDDAVLVRIAGSMEGGRNDVAEVVVDQISNERHLEPIIMGKGWLTACYAAEKVVDEMFALKLFKQLKDSRLRMILVKKIPIAEVITEICAYDKYNSEIFVMIENLKDRADIQKVSQSAKLKGVRILAASKLDASAFAAVVRKEAAGSTGNPSEGRLAVMGYYLGMSIEDMFAKLAAEFPDVKPTLYLSDGVLCIAGASGRDIAWANADTLTVHWIALPPSVVKHVAGFKTGSFEDLERAVEKKLGVSFGYDVIRKGNVSQKIGNLENTEGETLRYFTGEIGEGEDFGRSVRKAINQHTIDTNPLNGGFGAALANAFEVAQQADENRANAQRPMFQPQGSLQLLFTKNAAKGTIGAKGSFNKNVTLGAALQAVGELGQKMEELNGAKKELGDAWSNMKSEVKKEMRGAVGEENVKDLKKSMDELKAAADALKNLGK